MTVTVTLNPAIDYHITMDHLIQGQGLPSTQNSFFAGGKGINVAQVLHNLSSPTLALAFIGGFSGNFILSQAQHIIKPIPIQNNNRINVKIKDLTSETEIHGVAPEISSEEFQEMCLQLKKIPNLDVLVLSGSIPKSLENSTYKTLAQLCPKHTKIIIDTRGEALKECLGLDSIFLLKPNHHEIAELFNCSIESPEQALLLAQELKRNHPIEHLILSLGSEGAYFLHNDQIFFAPVLKGELISSVGAGDSVVAGFIAKYQETQNALASFQYGIACGTGTAFSQGLCSFETAENLYSKINIIDIK